MDRGDVLSGYAFKAVLRGALVFLVVLVTMAWFSLRLIDRVMTEEVQLRVLEMARAMSGVPEANSPDALIERIEVVTRGTAGQTLAYALFDADGNRITGNTRVRPAHGTWLDVPLLLEVPSHIAADAGEQQFLVHAVPVDDRTLVVGRSTDFIASTKRTAIRGFALTGFIVVLAMLGIGYVLSRRSQTALEHMEAVLDRVSRGETQARIEGIGADQISRIARRINEHLDQLDALFQQTQRTAASVAHDLRRPLARALLGMERALARVEAGEDARGEIEQALADLSQLQSLIASILRIARIESGELGAMKPFDLREILDEVAETFRPVVEDAAQHLVYSRADAPLTVEGDPEMLAQFLVNLVQNAITHAGDGATIRLAAMDSGEVVELSVSDDGPGIPTDLRDKVFEPFFRADAARSREGSGLGLALVRAIADRHGGTLRVEDAEPGLRVTLCLPKLMEL